MESNGIKVEIKKFENIYGIKKLYGVGIEGSAIFYARNGTAKTSLAKGFRDIKNGILPKDLITNEDGKYDIILDGKEYTNKNIEPVDNILVYNYDEYLNNDKYSSGTLAMSSKISDEYNSLIKSLKDKAGMIIDEIGISLGYKKNNAYESTLNFFKDNFNLNSSFEILLYLSKLDFDKYIDSNVKTEKIINNDAEQIINSKSFKKNLSKTKELVKKLPTSILLKNDFLIDQANDLNKALKKDKYFEANHMLKLSDEKTEIHSIEEYNEILQKDIKILYDNEETSKELAELKKSIDKKKNKELFSLFDDETKLLSFDNYDDFKNKIIMGKIKEFLNIIISWKDDYVNKKSDIENILNEANNEQTRWEKVIEEFRSRFTVPFTIEIENKKDAIVGRNIPKFNFIPVIDGEERKDLNTNKNDLMETLSTGEKRAYTILNLIYDVEDKKLNSKDKILVILDDVVDSFDYKNKYALIQYLSESDSKITYWILTHNFDFYTTCISRLGGNKYFISRGEKGIEISPNKSKENKGGLTVFSKYLDDLRDGKEVEKNALCLIPVARNILELNQSSITSEKYHNQLSKYLHDSSEIIHDNLSSLEDIFNYAFHDSIKITNQDTIINSLEKAVNEIDFKETNALDLRDKLLLSILIRVKTEKRLRTYDSKEILDNYNQLGQKFVVVKENITDKEELDLINEIVVSIPDFIHLNSFMFEPLIDIDLSKYKEMLDKINKIIEK